MIFLTIVVDQGRCQKPFQLFIFGFEYEDQAIYFCQGTRLNEINTKFILVNTLHPSEPHLVIDSIRSIQSQTQFDDPLHIDGLQFERVAISGGPYYAPTHLGIDTARILGFYGQYVAIGQIVCFAKELKSPLLYGYSFSRYEYGGNAVDLTNFVLRDTLIDRMDRNYRIGVQTVNLGQNKAITIQSCGGTRIEEIKMGSDFSEFTFHDLPIAGQSIPDSFAITYDFVPGIVGEHSRPISFRLSDGRWLTWIFEYRVRPAASVNTEAPRNGVTLRQTSERAVSVVSTQEVSRVTIVDVLGVNHKTFSLERSTEFDLDLSGLPRGVFFIMSPSFDSPLKLVLE